MMTGNEIRETFLKFFEERQHQRVRSSPLLPANDPTLLFTNAGMNQFKDVFLGLERRDYARACSSQKCIRAGGKHNDLDEVGKTARHHTFFEMLGNFSFGDYFKREAIQYAWDFLVGVLKLDPERMWFTVFGGDEEVPADEEAAALWVEAGARPERVLRFGRKDNFWQMAETGPCGPNSEINYYLGERPEDPEYNRADLVNGPGDTTMEIWNLVFMQYNRVETAPGRYKLEPLPAPSVDTGAGLERLAVVMQGVKSNYETDLIRDIVEFTARLADRAYEPDTQAGFAMRVIADHARATAFSIADGILPGNEGRNYVLRKIMRRAIYHGRHALQFEDLFFHRVTDFVCEQMREAFPELESSRDFIDRMVKLEEGRFASTLAVGVPKLHAYLATLSGEGAYPEFDKLAVFYDTYGVPRDLIRVILEERGFITFGEETFEKRFDLAEREMPKLDEDDYNARFDEALRELQQAGAGGRETAAARRTKEVYARVAGRVGKSAFTGYDETRTVGAQVVAVIKGDDEVDELKEGEEGEVVLDRTPFYAESGGQVGDTGTLTGASTFAEGDGRDARRGEELHAVVNDTPPVPAEGLIVHRVKVERGSLHAGQMVTAEVDVEKRDATRRNHTATHLMHAALREVLGTHVKQAGSVVAPNYLRFDFTHYQPLTRDEIAEIERLVNHHVLRNVAVETDLVALEEAMQSGAMALFGEKYAERVRVLTVPGLEGDAFSKELCGGTHVRATGDIGLFKITSDESIASGTRRIRAVTGADAFARFQETEALVDQLTGELRATRNDLPAAVSKLQEELKRARREAEELKQRIASGAASGGGGGNGSEAREVAGVSVLAREASELDAAGLRQLSDTLLARVKSGVIVLGRRGEGKVSLIVRTSPDLQKRVPAGQVIRELAPLVGGRGGGKPDMAEGGGSQADKLPDALAASYQVVERLLGQAPN
jgi:alanyl-tRNA synthetase